MRGEPRIAMTYFGEGSTANGQWHEAMNFAGIACLPVVFVLENNKFAYSTPNELEFAVDPVKRAESYGFPGVSVDGNDVEAVFEAARDRGRQSPCGRRADADRVPHDADARPRRARRHELRAEGAASRSGRHAIRSSGTQNASSPHDGSSDGELECGPPRGLTSTSRSARGRRSSSRCPTPNSRPKACSPTRGSRSATARRRGQVEHMSELTYLQAISEGLRRDAP